MNDPNLVPCDVGAETVRAICVRDPWVSLIERGCKTIEIRSWRTHVRGQVLLVSSARQERASKLPPGVTLIESPELGVTRVMVEVVDVRPMTNEDARAAMVPHDASLFSWVLANPRTVNRVAVKGKLGFFRVPVAGLEKKPA